VLLHRTQVGSDLKEAVGVDVNLEVGVESN
jgi:hypothetical protein